MRAHILQHLAFEGPGNIQPWLNNAGYGITFTVFSESTDLPGVDAVDFLVIMGGSMSANDEDAHPWLVKEKQFIREFISTGKPVLGICLGAQLIASALGAKVYRNGEKEIGWFPVTGIPSNDPSIFKFPELFISLHWHGETFDLPEGAILLASSEACKNQAFQYGENVLAIQFHPEVVLATLNEFVFHFKNEIVPEKFIQSKEEILATGEMYLPEMNDLIQIVLGYILRKI
jgi:GMP synthase-like glutamine amidotransferase